jgi:hypothetical protein
LQRRVVLLGCALVIALVVPSASAVPNSLFWYVSWADTSHGWSPWSEKLPCTRIVSVCATENGGRSWHPILDDPEGGEVGYVVRTSPRVGAVALTVRGVVWTPDNGRRWFDLSAIPHQPFHPPPYLQGHDRYLFWEPEFPARTLYQVTPWPPPRAVAGAPGVTSRPVMTLEDGSFGQMRGIPGGIVASISRDDTPRPEVLIRRSRRNRVSVLPAASVRPTKLFAAWPRLLLYGEDAVRRSTPTVLWLSSDGGKRWNVLRGTAAAASSRTISGRGLQLGARQPVPGGWVAPVRGGSQPRLAIRRPGGVQTLRLPRPSAARCVASAATPVVDWPMVLVAGRTTSGSTPVRWLSLDRGQTWHLFFRRKCFALSATGRSR